MVKMMSYCGDTECVTSLDLPWSMLDGKTILLSGATGMIGSLLVHVLMDRPEDIRVIAIGRNTERAKERFQDYWSKERFLFISHDINKPLNEFGKVDYVIHAASNTHPIAYAEDPIGTIATNIVGTKNMLDYAVTHQTQRFLFASSVEIYGENRGDTEYFKEDYCGHIDCNTLRAGYPESKRAGEALCQAYRVQDSLEIVIARFARTYGPSMISSDSKAIAQFIKKGLAKEDIVLKSEGTQVYSYSYVADAVSGMLTILLKGDNGEAYNVADINSNISLSNLAQLIAEYTHTKIVYELPDTKEAMGYSKATKALLDSSKLNSLGWRAQWDIKTGIARTLKLLS